MLTFVKPRGGEGQNGRLKCPLGFLVDNCKGKGSQNQILCKGKYEAKMEFPEGGG